MIIISIPLQAVFISKTIKEIINTDHYVYSGPDCAYQIGMKLGEIKGKTGILLR